MATPTTPGFSPYTPPSQGLPYGSPQPPQGGPPEAQGPQQGQGSQRPAPKIMELLGNWHRVSGEMGQVHPQIASAMQKVASETQSALMVLAREHVQGGGVQQGTPTAQTATIPGDNF